MIIVYSPKDGEPEHYDAADLKVSEASIAQRTVDMTWAEILAGIEKDEPEAMRVVVWVIKKRAQPSLRFGEFDPRVTELVSRMSRREVAAYVEDAFAQVGTTPEITGDYVAKLLDDNLPDVAADPEHARQLVAAMAQGPKDSEAPDNEAPAEADPQSPSESPSPTSPSPATSTWPSSDTSSTTPLTSSTA